MSNIQKYLDKEILYKPGELTLFKTCTAYVAWNKNINNWQKYGKNCIFIGGIWSSFEEAENDTKESCEIITISLDKLPLVMKEICNLDSSTFTKDEKRSMLISKFRQLVEVFIFRNSKLINDCKLIFNSEV